MLKWDVLFFVGDWIPHKADIRVRHPRLTLLRRRYFTMDELIYKAQRSAFCIYASHFRGSTAEEASLIARAGCPVLIDAKFSAQCPFGIPVDSPSSRIPGDVFSDGIATQAAIARALSRSRDEIRRSIPDLSSSGESTMPITSQGSGNGSKLIDWDRDWDENMLWNKYKRSDLSSTAK